MQSANFSHTLHHSVLEIPTEAWQQLIDPVSDIAMDQRLIHLMERTLADQAQFWTLIIRDEKQKIVAAAILAVFYADIIQSASPFFQQAIKKIRSRWPKALQWKILFCGLPVPSGHSHLRFAEGADEKAILNYMSSVMEKLAREQGAQMVVFKELDESQARQLEPLKASEFHRGELAPLFILSGEFKNFSEYEAAVRANYRRQIQANIKKFVQAELTVEHMYSPEAIKTAYTDAVHQLYLNIWDRAKEKLECFSAEFFRELAFAMPGQVAFTLIKKDDKPVAFSMGLLSEAMYYNLYAGIDYAVKDDSDLYFNLFYHELDCAFGLGKKVISLGQTSEHFKSRLGAVASPRYFYVRAMHPVIRLGLKLFHRVIFPKLEKVEEKKVFKVE